MVDRVLIALFAALAIVFPLATFAQQPQTIPVVPDAKVPGAASVPTPPSAPSTSPPALAAPVLPPEVTTPIERLAKSIEAAEKSIQQLKELESELQRLRGDVEGIIYESTATAEALRPQLAEVKSQIERLGPPPKDQAETPTIAAERARLNSLAGALDGAIKTTELAWVRGKQMIDRITVIRYQIFSRNLFERRTSPLLPSVWSEVADRFPTIVGRTKYYGAEWLEQGQRKRSVLLAVLAGALVAALLIRAVVNHLIARIRGRFELSWGIPTFFDRIISAAGVAPARMLAPLTAVCFLYVGMASLGMFYSPWERTAETTLLGVLIYVAGSVLTSVALAPSKPQWRLIPVDDASASYILYFIKAILAVYLLDTVLVEFGRAIYVPLIMTVAQSFITNIATAVLLMLLLLRPFVPQTEPLRAVNHLDRLEVGATRRLAPLSVKLTILVLAVAILASSAIGYVALGRYIAQQ